MSDLELCYVMYMFLLILFVGYYFQFQKKPIDPKQDDDTIEASTDDLYECCHPNHDNRYGALYCDTQNTDLRYTQNCEEVITVDPAWQEPIIKPKKKVAKKKTKKKVVKKVIKKKK